MLALPKRLKDTATAAMLLGAAAMPFGQAAHAGDDNVQLASNTTTIASTTATKVKTDPLERAIAAREYSKNNNAIGFFVNIAPGDGITHQDFGDPIARKFTSDGVPSAYSYNYASAGNSSVSFFVNGVPYASYGLSKAIDGYNLALAHYKNLQQTNEIAAKLGLNRD